jgi:hypothetical protein
LGVALVAEPTIKAGDTLRLAEEAGILYRIRPLLVRVIEVLPWEPYWGGTMWIYAYELDGLTGLSVEKRDLLVITAGIKKLADEDLPFRAQAPWGSHPSRIVRATRRVPRTPSASVR